MSDRPNILLVTIDSLRADYVYGDIAETPTLDAVADESVTYTNAFSQGPHTTFSMPSLFCSRYPSELEYVTFSENTDGVALSEEPTLAEVLREAGYETAGFHSNPLLTLLDFERGFDTWRAQLGKIQTRALPDRLELLADKLLRAVRKHAYVPAHRLNDRAMSWLEQRDDDRPFFLWLHYMDVHGPYQAKSGNVYVNKYHGERLWQKAVHHPEEVTHEEHERLKELYRIEVEYTDRQLGELLDALDSHGLTDKSVTVITADHGEQFGERGQYTHPPQVYTELTNVPLLYRDPDISSLVRDDLVGLVDIAPTLVSRARSDVPRAFTGSELPHDNYERDKDAVVSEAALVPEYIGSIRTENWTVVRDDSRDQLELFDRTEDCLERHDIAADHPAVLESLTTQLERVRSGTQASDRSIEIDDEEIKNRLQDLGYFG